MARKLPDQIRRQMDLLREENPELASADALFETVVELAEYVAAHERLIRAKPREFEPDHLVARIFQAPESVAFRAIDDLLGGLSDKEVERLTKVLTFLEQQHGRVKAAKPNHRILVDGAILGDMAFAYTRSYREVLATRAIYDRRAVGHLFPELLLRVDEIFQNGRPAYLWRLGPEFGTDRNVDHLLDRGDDFILRSLYRSRAKRLARRVDLWKELPDGFDIGENCRDNVHRDPARILVLRWTEGGATRYGSLVTNLANVPWEEIYRFYMNRSGKKHFEVPTQTSARKRLAASFMVLALFTYRNFRTWAFELPDSSVASVNVSQAAAVERSLQLIQTHRPLVLDRMTQIIEHLNLLAGGDSTLPGVWASPNRMHYQIEISEGVGVPLMADGTVIHVERNPDVGLAVIVDHGEGVSTSYENLDSMAADCVVGAKLAKGHQLGSVAPEQRLHFAANLASKYLDYSILPSVAQQLSNEDNLLFDPLGLLTSYAPTGPQADPEPLVGSEGYEAPRPSDMESADVYRFTSPDLGGQTIFVASALLVEEIDLAPLPDVYDDDVEVTVLGVEVS